jgi:uncharacterized membrane protein YvlD (DUF360 family)
MGTGQLINVLVGIVLGGVIGGAVILLVSKLNLGLWVQGVVAAFVAAIMIAIIGAVVDFVLTALGVPNPGGIIGLVERLIVAVVVLLLSDKLLSGLTVYGVKGAMIAAVAISVILWVSGLFLEAMGLPLVV